MHHEKNCIWIFAPKIKYNFMPFFIVVKFKYFWHNECDNFFVILTYCAMHSKMSVTSHLLAKKNLRCAWTIVKSHQFEKPSIFMRPFSAIRWKSRSHFSNQMLKNFYRHLRWKDKEFENAFVCQSHCEKCLVCHPYYIYTFRSLTSLPHLLK